jgi:recombination protein RecR
VYEGPIQDLIDELARLPGVGPKSAQRLAFWLVKADPADAKRLAAAIVQVKTSNIRRCEINLGRAMRHPLRYCPTKTWPFLNPNRRH